MSTSVVGELAPLLPSATYFIFLLFPVSDFGLRAVVDPGSVSFLSSRLGGLGTAAMAGVWAIMARYGVRDLLTFRYVGRTLLFVCLFGLCMLGGFRGILFINLATFGLLFYMEGLLRTRLLPVMTVLFALVVVAAVPFTDRLPFSIQRSLSFLPVKIDPAARLSAEVSPEWRLQTR